ncbi:MAG: copper resistance protein CopC [Gammaproteobacteria bacterium]|nr:copper resistance protein CopC [Gammaproteobacteria bacterium]
MKKLVTWCAVGIFMFSSAVSAHTGLKDSTPASNAMLMMTPKQLALEFSSEVRLVKLYLRNSKAEQIKFDFKPSAKGMKNFNYQLPKLATGNYRVDWMIMGSDAHKMTGYYTFMVHDMGEMHNTDNTTNTDHSLHLQ